MFSLIKDKLTLYDDYKELQLECTFCFERTHFIKNCPKLHYIPDHERVIKKHLYSIGQQRGGTQRISKRKKKIQNLTQTKKVEEL